MALLNITNTPCKMVSNIEVFFLILSRRPSRKLFVKQTSITPFVHVRLRSDTAQHDETTASSDDYRYFYVLWRPIRSIWFLKIHLVFAQQFRIRIHPIIFPHLPFRVGSETKQTMAVCSRFPMASAQINANHLCCTQPSTRYIWYRILTLSGIRTVAVQCLRSRKIFSPLPCCDQFQLYSVCNLYTVGEGILQNEESPCDLRIVSFTVYYGSVYLDWNTLRTP